MKMRRDVRDCDGEYGGAQSQRATQAIFIRFSAASPSSGCAARGHASREV